MPKRRFRHADPAAAVQEFLRYLEVERGVSPKTLDWYRDILDLFARDLPDLSPIRFRAFVARIRRQRSPHTAASYLRALRHFAAFLVRAGILSRNPLDGIRIPRAERLPRAIREEDQEAIIRAARSERDRALLLLLRDTGMRASELLSLRWNQIDLEDRSCQVLGKGRKVRIVFFTAETAEALRRWREECDGDRVFPLRYSGLRAILRRLAAQAGVEGPWGAHAWRHAFGIRMARAGMPTLALQRLMGHSTPLVTEIYARLTGRDLKEMYDRYMGGRD
jgi:integrase/recombinase XerD